MDKCEECGAVNVSGAGVTLVECSVTGCRICGGKPQDRVDAAWTILRPLYDQYDNVKVDAHLDQWWLVKVTVWKASDEFSAIGEGLFDEALRAAVAELV